MDNLTLGMSHPQHLGCPVVSTMAVMLVLLDRLDMVYSPNISKNGMSECGVCENCRRLPAALKREL